MECSTFKSLLGISHRSVITVENEPQINKIRNLAWIYKQLELLLILSISLMWNFFLHSILADCLTCEYQLSQFVLYTCKLENLPNLRRRIPNDG